MARKTKHEKTPTIYVRVPAELKAQVAAACESERRTEKEVVTAALREYLIRAPLVAR